ncbi:Eco57I restriction-modification methylase domain-containing protein [Cedecea davisae]|uniref:Eco57I restriction-modification methylase domain-containing protein n=1 Tax=Cedecea davisae TaxID=158484 RepID=UPI00376EBE62
MKPEKKVLKEQIDTIRIAASSALDINLKSTLGQYYTPASVCLFMSSLFENFNTNVSILEPGSGSGSLTLAFISKCVESGSINKIESTTIDIENKIAPYLSESIKICHSICDDKNIKFNHYHKNSDFILDALENDNHYSHVIINPPYKKINSKSLHWKALVDMGIKSTNLYSAFILLSLKKLKVNGELVAIIPRSFCNGVYHREFRKYLIENTCIKQIHIFNDRKDIFSGEKILQENIIIHLVKGQTQSKIKISSSQTSDFYFDINHNQYKTKDMTVYETDFHNIVDSCDRESFIKIAANEKEQNAIKKISFFKENLLSLGLKISTGAVVDFRVKDDLTNETCDDSCALIYSTHLKKTIHWPLKAKKPNAIKISKSSINSLWKNNGSYIILRRFSPKEEKRRLVATYYDGSLPGELIGFDNKLNIIHYDKTGIDELIAKGLYVYLNSSVLDDYYRLFGGNTQVNATDIRHLPFPSIESLKRMGAKMQTLDITQEQLDNILNDELIISKLN